MATFLVLSILVLFTSQVFLTVGNDTNDWMDSIEEQHEYQTDLIVDQSESIDTLAAQVETQSKSIETLSSQVVTLTSLVETQSSMIETLTSLYLDTYGRCDDGYHKFEDQCYKYKASEVDYETARTFCESEGGHLAAPRSKEQNDFIDSLDIQYPMFT